MRTTSVYTLVVQDEPGLLDRMVEVCPWQVDGSSIVNGEAKLRFRVEGGDSAARTAVWMIFSALGVDELPAYTLRTGLGVNAREVAKS